MPMHMSVHASIHMSIHTSAPMSAHMSAHTSMHMSLRMRMPHIVTCAYTHARRHKGPLKRVRPESSLKKMQPIAQMSISVEYCGFCSTCSGDLPALFFFVPPFSWVRAWRVAS